MLRKVLTLSRGYGKLIKRFGEAHKTKHGEVSEWLKELVLKTSDPERDRGFKSHLLRFTRPPKGGFVIAKGHIS